MPPPTAEKKLSTPIAIIIAGVLIAGAVYFGISSQSASTLPNEQKVDIKKVKIEGEPYIGKADAPVTMAYWSDFQCPFCKAVEVGGVPQIPLTPAIPVLKERYIDTGKLRIVFKDYAFLGEDSTTAALYGRAMWELYPEKYWEWREAMYKAQDDENSGFGNEASVIELTAKIDGVDAERVKNTVAEKRDAYIKLIDADGAEGAKFGISGTPGFITGKRLIGGAAQPEAFARAIDEQLK